MDEEGNFDGSYLELPATRTLDQLVWWANALVPARAAELKKAA
jgi:hypothetical protein